MPYVRHADEQTLRTKEGFLVSFIKLDGFCFQTADQSEINLRLSARNTLVRALNDSRFALYSHIIRRQVPAVIPGIIRYRVLRGAQPALYGKPLRQADVRQRTLPHGHSPGFSGQGRRDRRDAARSFRKLAGRPSEDLDRDARRELKDAVANIVNALEPYGARVLKVVSRALPGEENSPGDDAAPRSAIYSEPCEFLAQLLNGGVEIPMLLPRMGLDGYLPTRRITFGKKALEIRGTIATDTRFGAMLSVREYPAWSGPGMLDGLLRVQGEFIVSQSFAIADRGPVLTEVARVERQIAASDEKGTEVETAIATARNELVTGRTVLGKHHLTMLCLGPLDRRDGALRSGRDDGGCKISASP